MKKNCVSMMAGLGLSLGLAGSALADEAAENMVDAALQHMYHSCASVVEEANGDNAYIEKVVRALAVVSLYNHQIVVADLAKTEAEKTALRERFVAALTTQCKADKEALLAGAVDDAIMQAISSK